MLQQDAPDDYVIATGETHSRPRAASTSRSTTSASTRRGHVEIDPQFFRPAEVDHLVGDCV